MIWPPTTTRAGPGIGGCGAGDRGDRQLRHRGAPPGVVTGTTASHVELEREPARLTRQPACLTLSSGYTANTGVLTAPGDQDTLIVSDAHIHPSLTDGARLSRSPAQICPHSDLDALARLLRDRAQPRATAVTESIYPVPGDAADLPAAAALCTGHDAPLVVDEAHATGVAGSGTGRPARSRAG